MHPLFGEQPLGAEVQSQVIRRELGAARHRQLVITAPPKLDQGSFQPARRLLLAHVHLPRDSFVR